MGNFVAGTRDVHAPLEAVWALLADVDAWPRTFAPHLRAAHLDGPLAVGATGWVQLRLPSPRSPFAVTSLTEGTQWAWRGRLLWLTMDYDHRVARTPAGCRVTFDVDLTGPLGSLARGLGRPVYRRQMERALDLLAARAEAMTRPPG
jgi:hypothetical protein